MRPGPAPTPSAVLKLRGSHRATTGRENEPAPPIDRIMIPGWLSKGGKKKARAMVKQMKHLGLITVVDTDALAVYAECWSQYVTAVEFIEKNGQVRPVYGLDGKIKGLIPWPQMKTIATLTAILLRYQQEFGMTPSSRTRVQTGANTEPENEKSRFFQFA